MFSLHDRPAKLCDGINRRELLRVGGLSTLGLSLPQLLQAQASASVAKARDSSFGRAKNIIYLWLQGGPPQHETFDPKPNAPEEIRGEFKPIATNVPGIQICELLPRTAAIADKLAIVRSICTHSDLHDGSGYWVLTGYKYAGQQSRLISPTDWPYMGSIIKMLKPSQKMPSYTSVWLPDVMRLNDNVQPAGQTAGFLGKRWEPERIICDPSDPEFRIEGLALPPDIPPLRLSHRQTLLTQVDEHFNQIERGGAIKNYDRLSNEALAMIASGKAREAFDIRKEPKKVRERYGRGKWGQCVLLARRLIESGARLVHVNWPREGGDSAVDNPLWDTHAQNADRLQDVLCPQFDIGFTALIEDLEQRGLLSETLVVVIGEFGRTPKHNAQGGRDHWGHVFSYVMAGAGIRTAQVYGSSDNNGAYPKDGRHEPQDLTATIFHLLGIGHDAMFPHPTGRPIKVTEGEPIYQILGGSPATEQRTAPGGNLNLVPEYNDALLLNVGFEDAPNLIAIGSGKRLKGWQARPLLDAAKGGDLGVSLMTQTPRTGKQHAAIGIMPAKGVKAKVTPGTRAVLVQEIRNFRAGHYTLNVHVTGAASSRKLFDDVFLKNFTCRLSMYRYTEPTKDPTRTSEVASQTFQPVYSDASNPIYQKIEFAKLLDSRVPNVNFAVGNGLGIAIIVEKTTPGPLELGDSEHAFICIDDVELIFTPRVRNDEVMV